MKEVKREIYIIEKLIESRQVEKNFTGGVKEETIQYAEEKLQLIFPLAFHWFLRKYGAGCFNGEEFFGLIENPDGTVKDFHSIPNIIWITLYLRENAGLPQDCFALWGDGFGAYYGVKTDIYTRVPDGRMVWVKINDREAEPGEQRVHEMEESFCEFFMKLIQDEVGEF